MNKVHETEVFPVQSARLMAFLTLFMSLGFVAALYVSFLKGTFYGFVLIMIICAMLGLSFVSSLIALKRLMKKILCQQCDTPFFSRVVDLFLAPEKCQSCHEPLSN